MKLGTKGLVVHAGGGAVHVMVDAVEEADYPSGPVYIIPIGPRDDDTAYFRAEPENVAERAVRLLRDAADALDEVPVRMRTRPVLLGNTTPDGLRLVATTIETKLEEARALLAEIEEPS